MITTVFFDMYGTLAGFSPPRFEVQSEACTEFKIEITREGAIKGYAAADAFMADENARNPLRLRTKEGKEEFFSQYEQLILRGNGVKVSLAVARDIWRQVCKIPHSLKAFDDVAPALSVLKARQLTLGLISNIARNGDELVADLGLTDQIDFTVTSADVGVEKPNPAIFAAALSKAVAEPHETVHVGDQPTSDIEGALAVGIRPVLLDRDGIHPGYNRCPRAETLTDIPDLLKAYPNQHTEPNS